LLDVPPAGGVLDAELPHPVASVTSTAAAAVPRTNLRIKGADIWYLTSGEENPNGCLIEEHVHVPATVQ
jgi:hypothetical protein